MKYEVPAYEIVMLNTSDVITASPDGPGGSAWDLPIAQ